MIFNYNGTELDILAKDELNVGQIYHGDSRNTESAYWDGVKFIYSRFKYGGHYEDTLPHPEDDDGTDVFCPIRELNIKEIE